VCPGDVSMTIHPPIETRDVPRDGVRELADRVREVIRRGVDESHVRR
jgi:methyl coenzyme M reductase gamma subunit